MPKTVYVLGDVNNSPQYFNTRKEADAVWRSRDEPERVEPVDAAAQCTELQAEVDTLTDQVMRLTYFLIEVLNVADNEAWMTDEIANALRLLRQIDPDHIELPDLLRTYERINGRPLSEWTK